ncbi:MAG: Hsp20/alpha crystallin family protein [Candidatus Omnitrophota bacterium]
MKNRLLMWACPDVAIYQDERERNVIAEVELPGVSKKDITLDAGEAGFCITAQRDDARFDSCYWFDERVETGKIQAHFDNGLLRLTAPISRRELHQRRINVM